MRIALNTLRTIYRYYHPNNAASCSTQHQQFLIPSTVSSVWRRFGSGNMPTVNYDEVKSATHDKKKLIIDVREPQELLDTGVIPGSINIPLGRLDETLRNMKANEFIQKFGRQKPKNDAHIIFSCKSGRRSAEAQTIARNLGYSNTYNYSGGYIDWENKEKKQ